MLRRVILLWGCCALMGCSTLSPDYEIILSDGRRIEVRGWPQLDEATGYYRCQQQDGRLVEVHEGQVTSISVKDSR